MFFGEGFSLWNESGFINDGESDLGSMSCNSFTDATVIAINSYDANQALIAKQAEQIKILRKALEEIGGYDKIDVSNRVFDIAENALEATKEQA